MRIAVILKDFHLYDAEKTDRFKRETLNRLAAQHPQHEFICFADPSPAASPYSHTNITCVTTGKGKDGAFSWYKWLEWQLPFLLKKYNADVLFSPAGMMSLRSKIKTCLFLEDISFEHFPESLPFRKTRFLKRYVPRYVQQATTVATVSEFSGEDIAISYGINREKIRVVHSGVNHLLRPLSWEEREEVKKEFTDGKEYLVYTGTIHPRANLLNLLKAFSILKIRLYPNMQLALAGQVEKAGEAFVTSLDTYRFRQDIKLFTALDETSRTRLIGAAYALVYPPAWESFGLPVLEALRCEVPVIASGIPAVQEAGGEAVLYFDPGRVEDMGDKLCQLYKDEQLRSKLIRHAGRQVEKFSWDQTAAQLWECIEKAGNT